MRKMIEKEVMVSDIKYVKKQFEATVCDQCGEEIITHRCSFCSRDLCFKCNNNIFDDTSIYSSYKLKATVICALCAQQEPYKSFIELCKKKWAIEDQYNIELKKLKK